MKATTTLKLKSAFIATIALMAVTRVNAQLVSLNQDGSAPNTNAQLDIKSTGLQGKGLLIPRMTQSQRTVNLTTGGLLNALGQLHGGAAQGLIVYQTDGTQGFYYNTSITATPSWSYLSSGGSGPTGATGPTGAAGSNGAAGATGATGVSESWLTGAAAPTGGQGSVGDWYFRTSNNEVLEKTASTTWTSRSTIVGATGANGAAGAAGPTGVAGATGPTGAAGATGTSENWISGATAPTGGQGAVGDWYYNTATNTISEKTAVSTWTTRATITGATGATGAAGANGTNGTNGTNGAAGATGPAGVAGPTGPTGPAGSGSGWGLTGNASTNPSTNFIGTTDSKDLVVRTNGTERMRVTSAGNIGIGTTTPSKALDVVLNSSGTNVVNIRNTNAAGYSSIDYFNNSGNQMCNVGYSNSSASSYAGTMYFATNADVDMTWAHNNTEVMRLATGGYLGIGTASPSEKLDVIGHIKAGATSGQEGGQFMLAEPSLAGTGNWVIDNFFSYSGGNKFRFWNDRTGVSPLNIIDNGYVGIGVFTWDAQPSTTLHIKGSVRIEDGTQGAGKVLTSDADGNATWSTPSSSSSGWGLSGNSGISASNFIGTTDSKALSFKTNNTERLNIGTGGDIGIGTATPLAKLDVFNGHLAISNNNNTAGEARFYEPSSSGSNYTAFKAPAQSANITYTLPSAAGSNGQVLTTDASGTLSWVSPSSSASNIYTSTAMTLSGTANHNISFSSAGYVKFNSGSSSNFSITGLSAGADGQILILYNVGTGNMTVRNQNSSSSASNRIATNTGSDVSTTGTGTITLIYDGTQSRWVVINVLQ